MKNLKIKNENAITLIALIITVIILVILAAVSIRAVYNMGIVNHAVNGTSEYARAAKNEEKLMNEITSYMENKLGMLDKEVLARDKLIINEEGTTDAEISPYVKYKGELFRVLYDLAYDEKNGTNYGIEIVSVNPLDTVTIGKNDPIILDSNEYEGNPGEIGTADRAKWSYNNMIATLNKKAQSYLTDLADRARCIGSDPNNPLNEAGYYTGSDIGSTDAGELKGQYISLDDYNQLIKIDALKISDTSLSKHYIFARRTVGKYLGYPKFQFTAAPLYQGDVGLNASTPVAVYYYDSNGTPQGYSSEMGFRPVIKLKSSVKIKKGKGTLDEPYELVL